MYPMLNISFFIYSMNFILFLACICKRELSSSLIMFDVFMTLSPQAFAYVHMFIQQAGSNSVKKVGKERAGNCISIIME